MNKASVVNVLQSGMASTSPWKASWRNRIALHRRFLSSQARSTASAIELPPLSPGEVPDHQKREVLNEMRQPHVSPPSTYLGDVFMTEGRRKGLNIFVSLMFIHLRPRNASKTGTHQSPTTPRRVLLDTGADFNLISSEAHAELDLSKQPYHGRVRSIGGYTELNCTVILQWHFRNPDSESAELQRPHRASFYLLPPESDTVKFDCILGRPWIEENWAEFIALVDVNRRKEVA